MVAIPLVLLIFGFRLVPSRRYADKHRKPQSAFCVDHSLDVPLTTNKPREVEMIHPETGLRERLFESCSAAARVTNINRTKISRSKSLF